MSRMIFDLTEGDREALEAIRKHRGHRSQAETLRELIREAASSGLPSPAEPAATKDHVRRRQSNHIAITSAAGSFKDGDEAKVAGLGRVRLHLGPTAAKPGSRLKKR